MKPASLIRLVLFPFALGIALASFAFGADEAQDSKATSETATPETHAKVGGTEKSMKSVHKKKFDKHGKKVKEKSETTSESQH